MIRLIFNGPFRFSRLVIMCAIALAACESPYVPDDDADNVHLHFDVSTADATRALSGQFFGKLNIQLFDADGQKVFSTVRTQSSGDSEFGSLSLNLSEGTYTVVAVGHSSKISATIKSPTVGQFTASDGEKLTDTFCHCSQIVVGGSDSDYHLNMYRAAAMFQLCLRDSVMPPNFAHVRLEYTGGSANFNPSTLQGITKSTQSELRTTNGIQIYQAYTFPYMADSCKLKMTVTALDINDNVIRSRVFDGVPVTRNRITIYQGPFFQDGDGQLSQSDFSFIVNADWDGEIFVNF